MEKRLEVPTRELAPLERGPVSDCEPPARPAEDVFDAGICNGLHPELREIVLMFAVSNIEGLCEPL